MLLSARWLLILFSCISIVIPGLARSANVAIGNIAFGNIAIDYVASYERTSLKELKRQAKKERNLPLIRAVNAVAACQKLECKLGISQKELISLALFIETDLKKYIAEKKYYLRTQETALSCPIEYDPETGYCFIHLHGTLAGGSYKTITRCIRYDVNAPELFAACTQTVSMDKEIEMAKALRGSKGLLQLRAITKRTENGLVYQTLFCKLYQSGSLSTVLDKRSIQFTLEEKLAITLDILKGLEAMQTKGIVHRDLRKENYLIDVKKKRNKRVIEAVICDFGYASYANEAQGLKAQGTTAYIAPEGLFTNKLQGSDYYKTDLFAAGCVLYRLFYNKKPKWQISVSASAQDTLSIEMQYKKLISCLEQETNYARDRISAKLAKGLTLSPKESLENVILTMAHPNPLNRSTASKLRQQLEAVKMRKHKKAE